MNTGGEERRLRETLRKSIDEIVKERDYQLKRWGTEHDAQHNPNSWLVILSVYLGKTAQCVYPYAFADDADTLSQFRKRVTQLGAICAAILESTDSEIGSSE